MFKKKKTFYSNKKLAQFPKSLLYLLILVIFEFLVIFNFRVIQ